MTDAVLNQIINSGYGYMVQQRINQGWEGYLMSFMFNGIRGSRQSVIQQMQREVQRVYATVLTRIIRPSRNRPIADYPFWIVCPDYPVPKRAKIDIREVRINGGLHMQGIALVPPLNRMNETLAEHFEMQQDDYVRLGLPLSRVHA